MTEDPNVHPALPVGVAAAQVPLPPLPRAFADEGFAYYLPDQMEAYARAAVALAEREVEALRADARRLEFWFSNDAKSVDMAGYLRGVREGWSLGRWREFMDAGMAANKSAATPEAGQNGNEVSP